MLQNKAYMVLTGNTNCASFPPPPKRKKKKEKQDCALLLETGSYIIFNDFLAK